MAARSTSAPVAEVSFHSSSVQLALRCMPRKVALSLTTLWRRLVIVAPRGPDKGIQKRMLHGSIEVGRFRPHEIHSSPRLRRTAHNLHFEVADRFAPR